MLLNNVVVNGRWHAAAMDAQEYGTCAAALPSSAGADGSLAK